MVTEIDKVNAFGQVVERDFMSPMMVSAPKANPNNLMAGATVVSERLISVQELADTGRFFEEAPVRAGTTVSAVAQPVVYETFAQPVVEYVTPAAPVVEYVSPAPAVEYVSAAPMVEYGVPGAYTVLA
jgi:hypothetical protein